MAAAPSGMQRFTEQDAFVVRLQAPSIPSGQQHDA